MLFRSQQFTSINFNAYSGIVNESGNFYLYNSDATVYKERKNYLPTDYQDKVVTVSITVVTSSYAVTLASSTDVEIGMYLVQGAYRSKITDIVGNDLTLLEDDNVWLVASATASTPIPSSLVYQPISIGDKSSDKQFQEFEYIFGQNDSSDLTVGFSTDLDGATESVTIVNVSVPNYGLQVYGSTAYGGGSTSAITVNRTYVPRQKQWAHWIMPEIRNGDSLAEFAYYGLSVTAETISDIIPT